MLRPFAIAALSLLTVLSVVGPAWAVDEANAVEVLDWKYNRIWKSAAKSKTHFFEAKLALRNSGKRAMNNVVVNIKLKNEDDTTITASPRLNLGTISAGSKKTKSFDISRAFEFSEAVMTVTYTVDGKKVTERFSAGYQQPFDRSNPVEPGSGGVAEIKVMNDNLVYANQLKKKDLHAKLKARKKLDRKLMKNHDWYPRSMYGKKAAPTFLTIRLRNKWAKKAKNVVAEVDITYNSKKSSGPIKVLLADEIPGGADRTISLVDMGNHPPFQRYSIKIISDFEGVDGSGGISSEPINIDGILLSPPVIKKGDDMWKLNVAVKNQSGKKSPFPYKVQLVLRDKQNKVIAELFGELPESLADGNTSAVEFFVPSNTSWYGFEFGVEY